MISLSYKVWGVGKPFEDTQTKNSRKEEYENIYFKVNHL